MNNLDKIKKFLTVPLSTLFLLVVGCAAKETMDNGKAKFDLYRLGSDTVVTTKGDNGLFQISSHEKGLLASVTDRQGNVVLGAMVDAEGRPDFAIFDKNKDVTIKLGLGSNFEPAMMLNGKSRNSRAVLNIKDDGLPLLSLTSGESDSGPSAKMSFEETKGGVSPYFLLQPDKRNYQIKSKFGDSGAPLSEMTDSKGRVRLRFGIGENDAPYIELLDESGKPTWSAR